jgi:hypothetical protein
MREKNISRKARSDTAPLKVWMKVISIWNDITVTAFETQRWGTPEALRKAGIPVLEKKTAAEKKEDSKTRKRTRGTNEEDYSNESKTEEDRVIEQEWANEFKYDVKDEKNSSAKEC